MKAKTRKLPLMRDAEGPCCADLGEICERDRRLLGVSDLMFFVVTVLTLTMVPAIAVPVIIVIPIDIIMKH